MCWLVGMVCMVYLYIYICVCVFNCSQGRSKGTILDVDYTHTHTHTDVQHLYRKTVVYSCRLIYIMFLPASKAGGKGLDTVLDRGCETINRFRRLPEDFFLTGSLRFFRVSLSLSHRSQSVSLYRFPRRSIYMYGLYQIPCIGRVL